MGRSSPGAARLGAEKFSYAGARGPAPCRSRPTGYSTTMGFERPFVHLPPDSPAIEIEEPKIAGQQVLNRGQCRRQDRDRSIFWAFAGSWSSPQLLRSRPGTPPPRRRRGSPIPDRRGAVVTTNNSRPSRATSSAGWARQGPHPRSSTGAGPDRGAGCGCPRQTDGEELTAGAAFPRRH